LGVGRSVIAESDPPADEPRQQHCSGLCAKELTPWK
jgi:hypothetical protein